MPMYDLKCKKCGREFEAFARVHERNAQSCPACGAKCEVQVGKSVSGFCARITNAAWGLTGGRSLSFAFKDRAKTLRDIPSAEFDDTGALVYRSDSHQRKVFQQMRDAKTRHEEAAAAKRERAIREGRMSPHHESIVPAEFSNQ